MLPAAAFALACLFAAELAIPQGGRVRTVALTDEAQAIEAPIALSFDSRVTLVAPAAVRLVVPGSADVLSTHIKDTLVVLTLVDSDFVRRGRPSTNLTVILVDGTAIVCRVVVVEPRSVDADLIRFERGPLYAPALASATEARLISTLDTLDALSSDDPLRRAVERRVQSYARHEALRAVAQGPVSARVLGDRTKSNFIYATAETLLLLGDDVMLRATLRNQTQAPFEIGKITADLQGQTHEVEVFASDRRVLPDGLPRAVALRLPRLAFEVPTSIRICETAPGSRCVTLALEND